jgi:hypothetical protein
MAERPDFVIAGAAKCGTTALFEYLSQHPSVFMPTLKEPGFFSTDLIGGVSTLEEYHALFESAPPQRMTGEASTRYVYSRVAIARLLTHNPNVKVITMLRNPVDAAYSLHGYAYRYGHDDIADFELAWREQPAHFARRWRTPSGHNGHIFEYDYRATYRYAEQVRRVLDHVPEQQRHFVTYEDFFADPSSHYAKILEFLGLPPTASTAFTLVNAYTGVRSPRLERLLRRPPKALQVLYTPFRPLFKATGFRPVQLIRRMNWGRPHKAPLRPAFREELEHYFADDIAELESLLGRRLWNTGDV